MNTNKIWHLNPKEVTQYGGSSTISNRKNARQSRTIDERELTLNLIHTPTKLEVAGRIHSGNYSKKEMSRKRELLYKQLFSELEIKVAMFLKIPRR